ncbi:MAG: MFS transporter [Proteobacteria bacterium]|nr:MFS transporter [Pseudomonadota bacterium]
MAQDPRSIPVGKRAGLRGRAIAIVAAFALAGLLSQFLRSSHAAIAPEVVRDLGLSAEGLGVMTSVFFVAYGLSQPAIGVLLDRFGARLTVPAALVFAVLGVVAFGSAASLEQAAIGRFLMGIGCAPIYMGAFVVSARWFPPERFGTVAGVIVALGYFGNIAAATPMALASALLGWRDAFGAIALLTIAVGVALLVVVRDAPPGHPARARAPESLGAVIRGVRQVLVNRAMHRLLAMAVVGSSVLHSVFSLWGGPYLNDVHGLDAVARGNVLLAMAIATVVGSLAYGSLDRIFDTRKGLVLAGAALSAAILLVLALWPEPGAATVTILLTIFCLVGSFGVVITVHCRSLFPDHMAGRAMTTLNLVFSLSSALVQAVSGLIVGAFPGAAGAPSALAYRVTFIFFAAITFVAIPIYRRVIDVKPGAPPPGAEAV